MICVINSNDQFVFYKFISLNSIVNAKIITLINKNLVYIINSNFNTRDIFFIKKNIATLNER